MFNKKLSLLKFTFLLSLQVGSFNFDNRKMVFENYLLPVMPNHTKSILDYDVQIRNLRPEATFFVPAETGKKNIHSSFIATSLVSRSILGRSGRFLNDRPEVEFLGRPGTTFSKRPNST